MRVLAIGAHPDDIDIRVGGTLSLYAQQGHEIFMCIVTNGNIGSVRLSKKEIAEKRRKEAQASADIIGATLLWLDFDDEFLFDNVEARLAMIDAVRIARPDVIFAPAYNRDYNPDHDIAGYLAFIARINASIKLIETEHAPTDKIPPMFFCLPAGVASAAFTPEYYIDVTSVYDTKLKMLSCHKSQMEEWGEDFFGSSTLEETKRFDAYHAATCGNPGYVEAFAICKTYPIVADAYKLLPR